MLYVHTWNIIQQEKGKFRHMLYHGQYLKSLCKVSQFLLKNKDCMIPLTKEHDMCCQMHGEGKPHDAVGVDEEENEEA